MNSSLNDRETGDPNFNPLQSFGSLQPPEGMQERLTKNIVERVRQQPIHPVARGFRKYAWELWAGVSIAVVAAGVILCIFLMQGHRTSNWPLTANTTMRGIVPAPSPADVMPASIPIRKPAHPYRAPRLQRSQPDAAIPHTPPPQPITTQERLLLALANTPSLAAGVAQSQTISQHGLGPNALFELAHEQLQPMRSESRLLQPLPQNLP